MTQYFLGVDVGATKSHAIICDGNGRIIGTGIAGPGNHENIGKSGFQKTLKEVVARALSDATLTNADIAGMGFGIAGYDWAEDLPMMHEVISSLNIHAPYEVMNDAGPGLLAGSEHGWGVSVVAGTGVNARGRGRNGEIARVTGNGLLFAEIGGGSELAYRAINAISRAWSKRGTRTSLTDAFVRYVNAENVEDLLAGIARGRYHIGADAALLVFEAADAGDEVACQAAQWLGTGLGDLANGIIHQLDIAHEAFDVVLAGSIFQAGDLILDDMRRVVHHVAPEARFVHLQAPPVTGCVMLAMQKADIDFLPVRKEIIKNTQAHLTGA